MNRAIARMFLVGALLMVALMVNLVWHPGVPRQGAAGRPREPPPDRPAAARQARPHPGLRRLDDRRRRAALGLLRRAPTRRARSRPRSWATTARATGRPASSSSMNAYLSGADVGTQGLIDRVLGRHSPGANVRLTIVPAVQKVAQSALGGQVGAIVALDPQTGAVIAAASAPSYDPATIDTSFATPLPKTPARRCCRASRRASTRRARRSRSSPRPPRSTWARCTPTHDLRRHRHVLDLRRQGHQLPRRGLRPRTTSPRP